MALAAEKTSARNGKAVEAAIGALDAARVHTTEIIPAPHADFVAKLR